LLNQGEDIIPIPGTRSIDHLEENMQAAEINIDPKLLSAVGALINPETVSGERYPPCDPG